MFIFGFLAVEAWLRTSLILSQPFEAGQFSMGFQGRI